MSLSEKLEAARVALGKRKERALLAESPAKALAEPGTQAQAQAPLLNNNLLAGHLAHEFLTRGTLQGHQFEPTKPSQAASSDPGEPQPEPDAVTKRRRYAEVSWLLMASGARVPGIVNPTQFDQWLQIKE